MTRHSRLSMAEKELRVRQLFTSFWENFHFSENWCKMRYSGIIIKTKVPQLFLFLSFSFPPWSCPLSSIGTRKEHTSADTRPSGLTIIIIWCLSTTQMTTRLPSFCPRLQFYYPRQVGRLVEQTFGKRGSRSVNRSNRWYTFTFLVLFQRYSEFHCFT